MNLLRCLGPALLFSFWIVPAQGDVFRPAYLEIRETDANRYDVLWRVPLLPGGVRLGAEVRLPENARHVDKPRTVRTRDSYIKRYRVTQPHGLAGQTIAIEGLRGSVTDVIVKIAWLNGATDVLRILPEDPKFEIRRADGKGAIALSYLNLGVEHILTGLDHLLFVAALLLIVRGWHALLATITAFTVAHSLTLAAASLGWLQLPSSLVEAVIALSIVFVAAEVLRKRQTLAHRIPWLIACGFGLLHGFGFAGALAEIGLPETAIPLALFMFNVGVELGQIAFVASLLIFGYALRKVAGEYTLHIHKLGAYGIGATSAFWTIERVAAF